MTRYLHIGCGNVILPPPFENLDGRDIKGVDYVSTVYPLPFESNTFDLVYSSHVLEHFHRNETLNVLKEWFRVLKPGGVSFIHHSWLYGGSDNSVNNIAGRANMSPEQFKELVERYGMDIISQDSIKFESLGLWDGTDCISMFRKPF